MSSQTLNKTIGNHREVPQFRQKHVIQSETKLINHEESKSIPLGFSVNKTVKSHYCAKNEEIFIDVVNDLRLVSHLSI